MFTFDSFSCTQIENHRSKIDNQKSYLSYEVQTQRGNWQIQMISLTEFIKAFPLPGLEGSAPWEITRNLPALLEDIIGTLGRAYEVSDGIAIHKTAIVEAGVTMKRPVVVGPDSFIGANAYLRGGVYIDRSVIIGPGCEIKSSVICSQSAIAHFNFIGDSIIGSNVNFEAGAVTANYQNDKVEKEIFVRYNSKSFKTGVDKFGSLVGDGCKIGANAVLSPGTILPVNAIVGRLQLVDQTREAGNP